MATCAYYLFLSLNWSYNNNSVQGAQALSALQRGPNIIAMHTIDDPSYSTHLKTRLVVRNDPTLWRTVFHWNTSKPTTCTSQHPMTYHPSWLDYYPLIRTRTPPSINTYITEPCPCPRLQNFASRCPLQRQPRCALHITTGFTIFCSKQSLATEPTSPNSLFELALWISASFALLLCKDVKAHSQTLFNAGQCSNPKLIWSRSKWVAH